MIRKLSRRISVALRGPRRVRVVVLGHQKNGTTAVGALVAAAMNADYSNDPLYRADWGQGNLAHSLLTTPGGLRGAVRARATLFCSSVVKDPDLSFLIGEVREVFADAGLVFVVRDPRQTVRSLADRLELTSEDLGRESVLREDWTENWKLIVGGVAPAVKGATVVERLARRWKLAYMHYSTYSDEVHLIRYEDFKKDKQATIHQLVETLGEKVRSDISGKVDRPFQAPGVASVDLAARIGPSNLSMIEDLCAREMEELGYLPQTLRGNR
jgi:hypothetical protein